MDIIRYAIRKEDLHNLLRAIGVLRPTEHLLAVNNVDLVDGTHDAVVITVSAGGLRSRPEDIASWTDREIQQRLAELSILEAAATQQLQMLVEEMDRLRHERAHRSMKPDTNADGIPGTVAMNIREQLRSLLGGGTTDAEGRENPDS
ncbi:MAG: hypothetical protein RBU27_08635 [Bacteroidota bacterium]|jgi:hypothetical protein|nr:hypothetical protein [Bacteroidota bacterium]